MADNVIANIPQLRVHTEYMFRDGRNIQTYAPLDKIASALSDLGAPAAGIVDCGTWGHVRWAQALAKTAVAPIFGCELTVAQPDGRKPKAWVLATDTAQFYEFSSSARRPGIDIEELFRSTTSGVLRFAGAALADPDTFDCIDVNPASRWQQRRALQLARATGKPLVLTSDNAYAKQSDYAAFMAISGRSKVTPQHLLSLEEMRAWTQELSDAEFAAAVSNTYAVAERCAHELARSPMIHFDGDLRELARAGKARRIELGHVQWTDAYEARMQRELIAIEEKGFESYFFVVADLIAWAKQRMLVGPGRGSSAGSLVCYLIGITEVDPLPHELLFERFIDFTRKDLPDIDIDFSDRKRELCFDYLADKYGRACVARIGSINTMKPRTVLGRIGEVFALDKHDVFGLLNVLIEYSSGDSRYGKSLEDTLTLTEPGKAFTRKYPSSVLMGEIENHATHTGVHAAGVIVSNAAVTKFCTVGADGVAQLDKKDADYLNLLKIDALGLSTLGIIEDAKCVTADELYALKLDDPKVLQVFNDRKFAGIFQFEGSSQRSISAQIPVSNFRDIDHITALARPGPLGGGATNKYIRRKAGLEPIATQHPKITSLLADTFGVVLYQEQVMRIGKDIGHFSWEDVTLMRKAMSGRKGQEYFDRQKIKFIEGAALEGLSAGAAEEIWKEICTFGAWGMNKAHTCAYSVISYWCAFMKAYHPVEYAAACLRQSDDETKVLALLREMESEGTHYVPFDIDRSGVDWEAVDGVLVGGFKNLVGFGPAKSVAATEARRLGNMTDKLRAQIAKATVKYKQLYPLKAEFADVYANPEAFGCREGSFVLTADAFPTDGDVLYIGRLIEKEMRDENETVRVARRNGKLRPGQTLFADFLLKDDTGIPTICRVPPTPQRGSASFEPVGRAGLELLREGDVLMVRGHRIPNFPMLRVTRMKCISREVNLNGA